MLIPDDKVEEVRTATDIVEVVGDYVRLKRQGTRYVGLCPFHNEKTPSFGVTPSLGIFKCFGCGAGGDVFKFVAEVEKVGFVEAVRMLAERAGIALNLGQEDTPERSAAESLHFALTFAARFYFRELTQEASGRPGLAYFKQRGFSGKTIKHFGLGYAPDAWDALFREATANHISPEVLEQAGLVIPRKDGSGYYDRYRQRVLFPIFSPVGKVLGFGGRILGAETDQPKYINSPETDVYSKSRVLYGLFHGKHAVRKAEEAILVEGYTDVISLHQAGVENAVAACGTSLTEGHVKVLSRYAKRIVFINDADAAGDSATVRGIGLALKGGLTPYVVRLPSAEDPDSFVRENGGEAFQEYVQKHRTSFIEHMVERARLAGRIGGNSDEETAALHEIIATVAVIGDPISQESYIRELGRVTDRPDIQFFEVLARALAEQRRQEARSSRRDKRALPAEESENRELTTEDGQPDGAPAMRPSLTGAAALPEEQTLIRVMLEHGAPLVEFVLGHMAVEEFTEGPSREAVRCFVRQYQEGGVAAQPFLDGTFGEAVQRFAAEVMVDQYEPSENWGLKAKIRVPRLNEDPYEAASDAMTLLKLDRVDEMIGRVKKRQAHLTDASRDLLDIQTELMKLQELRKRIDRREFLQWNNAE
ncbi:MAG TPA: DNA primase [Rhodothermales bacterium]|nr:DNA primase [Rhodothermales bacterium]